MGGSAGEVVFTLCRTDSATSKLGQEPGGVTGSFVMAATHGNYFYQFSYHENTHDGMVIGHWETNLYRKHKLNESYSWLLPP